MIPFGPFLDHFQDVADQLARHVEARARAAATRSAAEKADLRTPAALEARRDRLRAALLQALGGLPERPAAVPATVTGTVAQAGFRIERLLLETLPGVHASANLYLPDGRPGPVPGVLFLCGHAREAKAHPVYQRVCRALASAGLAVLALDPVGQGERVQYLDADGAELVPWGTAEHAHSGAKCHVAGFGLARYLIADALQALSYLAARPEVDAARLGVTGNSGGGTQAAYVIFLDDRLACGAPCTYITSRERYLATGQAHDSEQNIPGALTLGLDHDDLLAGIAPKPLMIGAVASDYFCIEGTLQTYERLRRVYGLLGREQDLYLTVGPGNHGYSDVLRDRVAAFFRRHLLGEEVALRRGWTTYAGPDETPETRSPADPGGQDTLPVDALQVTRSGQVALDRPAALGVFDLNLRAWRERLAASPTTAEERRRRLAGLVVGERPQPTLWVRRTRSGTADGIRWAHRYAFSEPGIAVPMIELCREALGPEAPLAVVALPEGTAAVADQQRRDALARLLDGFGRLLLIDPRGVGAAAQRPINPAPYAGRFGTLYTLNYDAMMLDDSLFAMMAFDALRALAYAHRVAPRVAIAGEGAAGLALLAAAAVDGRVDGGRVAGVVASFADLVTERFLPIEPLLEVFGLAGMPDVPELLALTGAERLEGRL